MASPPTARLSNAPSPDPRDHEADERASDRAGGSNDGDTHLAVLPRHASKKTSTQQIVEPCLEAPQNFRTGQPEEAAALCATRSVTRVGEAPVQDRAALI